MPFSKVVDRLGETLREISTKEGVSLLVVEQEIYLAKLLCKQSEDTEDKEGKREGMVGKEEKEELDFPWERVRVRPAPAGRAYVDPKMGIQLSGGSTTFQGCGLEGLHGSLVTLLPLQ